jgi:hypothetical protein
LIIKEVCHYKQLKETFLLTSGKPNDGASPTLLSSFVWFANIEMFESAPKRASGI